MCVPDRSGFASHVAVAAASPARSVGAQVCCHAAALCAVADAARLPRGTVGDMVLAGDVVACPLCARPTKAVGLGWGGVRPGLGQVAGIALAAHGTPRCPGGAHLEPAVTTRELAAWWCYERVRGMVPANHRVAAFDEHAPQCARGCQGWSCTALQVRIELVELAALTAVDVIRVPGRLWREAPVRPGSVLRRLYGGSRSAQVLPGL